MAAPAVLRNLLPPEAETRVAATLKAARDETGVQGVVPPDSLAANGGAGQSIEAYAGDLFDTSGVGDPARNDGIVILVVRNDREMRIAPGQGSQPEQESARATATGSGIARSRCPS